ESILQQTLVLRKHEISRGHECRASSKNKPKLKDNSVTLRNFFDQLHQVANTLSNVSVHALSDIIIPDVPQVFSTNPLTAVSKILQSMESSQMSDDILDIRTVKSKHDDGLRSHLSS
ncbi:hypothetical protein PV326_011239, partial [Microctonus aethiopoides]